MNLNISTNIARVTTDSIMRSANPQAIRRVPLELPPGVFTESGVLERELRLGARYPEVRSGNVDASIITGRGVQALQAGFDTQVRAAQAQFARLFMELVSLCFEVDEKIFGSIQKEIKGVDDGTPFNMKYIPSKAIAGEYGVDVRYGIMSGMKVSIEADEYDHTLSELLEYFKSAALALTFQEESWKEAILTMADEYRIGEEDYYDTDNLSEELPEPIHVRSEYC